MSASFGKQDRLVLGDANERWECMKVTVYFLFFVKRKILASFGKLVKIGILVCELARFGKFLTKKSLGHVACFYWLKSCQFATKLTLHPCPLCTYNHLKFRVAYRFHHSTFQINYSNHQPRRNQSRPD